MSAMRVIQGSRRNICNTLESMKRYCLQQGLQQTTSFRRALN